MDLAKAKETDRGRGTRRFLIAFTCVLAFLALSVFALFTGFKLTERKPSLMTMPKLAPTPSALPMPKP